MSWYIKKPALSTAMNAVLTKKTVSVFHGPSQAPTAPISLTSPAPPPPISHSTSKMPKPTPKPANAVSK